MSTPPFDLEKAQRWFAIELNNTTWALLEQDNRTKQQDEQMIHAAHASCHHWLHAGDASNHARAECLVANAHAALGYGPAAIRHANRCCELIEANAESMADWDLPFGYDAAARAHAADGNKEEATRIKALARAAGDAIADEDDKKFFDAWFNAGEWHGVC